MEVHGVVISGVISPLIWVISIVTLLIALLITTHEPPSILKLCKGLRVFVLRMGSGLFDYKGLQCVVLGADSFNSLTSGIQASN